MSNVVNINEWCAEKMKQHDGLAAACGIVREVCDVRGTCDGCGFTEDFANVSGYEMDALEEDPEYGPQCPRCKTMLSVTILEQRYVTPGEDRQT